MENTNNITNEPGITIFYSQTSATVMLINFLIGDLFMVSKTLVPPVNINAYEGMNELSYRFLKDKVLAHHHHHAQGETVSLTMKESILMYMLMDIACKCFVGDINETLKTLAIANVKVSEEEYDRLRMNFLHYGQTLITTMNKNFQSNETFKTALEHIKAWEEGGV